MRRTRTAVRTASSPGTEYLAAPPLLRRSIARLRPRASALRLAATERMANTMKATAVTATVVSVSMDDDHRFSKKPVAEIELVAGLGVRGDAHAGVTVQHRSRVLRDPTQPNLRQVHLIHSELFAELGDHVVVPGDLGENITTVGIDLLGLPTNTVLHIGEAAVVQVTGLRNPCTQIDDFDDGLLTCVVERDDDGTIVRKAGVMGVVLQSGVVRALDQIVIELPSEASVPLAPV
jgi:hypothetical protein